MAKNTENKIVENAIVDLFGRDLINLLDQKKIKQSVALMKSLKIKKNGRRRSMVNLLLGRCYWY